MTEGYETAVLIACKNGEATIGNTVRSAVGQADVYVVSDGSTDRTCAVAVAMGAQVLECGTSSGKPVALRTGNERFALAARYRRIAVLDDDTTIEPQYIARLEKRMDADPRIAAASGRVDSLWDHTRRWNPFIAMRAFTYWSYQVTIKRGQNVLRVVNVICGANTLFRSDVFDRLIRDDVPYAVDDMYWVAEIIRRKLGRVEYVPAARSWTIDPHHFRDWYRQTVRWSWAQFQSIRGHRFGLPLERTRGRGVGVRVSGFDLAYLALMLDWIPYMLEPFVIPPAAFFLRDWIDPMWFGIFYLSSSVGWIAIAAVALRKPRLLVLAPVLIVLDLVYRACMLHAFVKTVVTPKIESCTWVSPPRFALETAPPVAAAAAAQPVKPPRQGD
ncbi:MAG: glycosyl transferase family 2 [Actinomycetia bacterium]|nr:glycosyl transferase family 2 [Actinomycetes bacterium]